MSRSVPVPTLLRDLPKLAGLLGAELTGGSWLNSYLLAAGMNQILEDYLHDDRWFVGKASEQLDRIPGKLPDLGARLSRSVDAALVNRRACSAAAHSQRSTAGLVQGLARMVVASGIQPRPDPDELIASGRRLIAQLDRLPRRLLRQVVRPPSCFTIFDLQPEDLEHIAEEFIEGYPDRDKPVRVAGIRTSGSYLAPLYAAFLSARGFQNVVVLTLRPGRPLDRRELATLGVTDPEEGLVLLVDDPPRTGGSVAEVAQYVQALGIPARSIVLLLPLFGAAAGLPAILEKYPNVLLPENGWSIHRRLRPAAVRAGLAALLAPDVQVGAVEVLPLPKGAPGRPRARVHCRAQLVEAGGEREQQREIFVRGVGLGYFGEHALAVGTALRGLVPDIYGLKDGLLYRAWLPEDDRACSNDAGGFETIARQVVGYVKTRNAALSLSNDVTMSLFGRDPAWEVASTALAQVFGRAWRLARVLLVDRAVRSMLTVQNPNIVDGSMALPNWFSDGAKARPALKIHFDEREFSNLNVFCSDPVFDLAGFAASFEDRDKRAQIRRMYEEETGRPVAPERWFLHQVVHAIDAKRTRVLTSAESKRRLSREVQRYLGEIFFEGLPQGGSGPICAVDLDGVLEVDWLGFPALTPAGALALRALRLHGNQVVLATGRSLNEVRERCEAYGLAGGVAEYGTVAYNHRTRRIVGLVPPGARAQLEAIRSTLGQTEGVHVDPEYTRIVRAYYKDPGSSRRGLGEEVVSGALAASTSPEEIRVVQGRRQTDFTAAALNKGTALLHLLKNLNPEGQTSPGFPLAFAIGDTREDLPMLRMAANPYAPSNAEPALGRAGVTVVGRRCQLGLDAAVTRFLGHHPGGCPACRPPQISADTRRLLAILATQDCKHQLGMIWHGLTTAARWHHEKTSA